MFWASDEVTTMQVVGRKNFEAEVKAKEDATYIKYADR